MSSDSVTSSLSRKSERSSLSQKRELAVAVAVNDDGNGSITAGRVNVRRYGQESYRSVSVKGFKQEGELSVLDGERSLSSLRAGPLSMDNGRQSITVGRVNVSLYGRGS